MTFEDYLEKQLWFYLEQIDEIEDLKDKLDILIKIKQINMLENIQDELSYIRSEFENLNMNQGGLKYEKA